jgi:AhpD family alkylhydroperoxidase
MPQRVNYAQEAPEALQAMQQLEHYLNTCGLEKELLDLVRTRVSQMNGCAYCLDLHARGLRQQGVDENKITMLSAWRETPWYSGRERAALEWAEAVTNIQCGHAPDDLYERAHQEFGDRKLAQLTLAITSINQWNRLGIAFRLVPTGGKKRLPQTEATQEGQAVQEAQG